MALPLLIIGTCFIPALIDADAAQKMRPPLPKPKPAQIATPAETEAPQPQSSEMAVPEPETQPDQALTAIVIPREKPPQFRKPAPEILPAPAPKPDAAQGKGEKKPAPGEDFAVCRNELAELGAKFTIPTMSVADERCTVANPVRISAIRSPVGEVAFPDGPILNCIFAKQFTTWVSDVAAPVVKARSGEAIAAMTTGPGYECRGRNGDSMNKISEHASGNAIDIVSFKLASKESIPVANVTKTGNVESYWLMALRISACGYFTTVLGPGANAAHANHYHLDLGVHGKSANYRICE
jgi:hypothetical protein